MASPKIQTAIRNVFEPNITESISAEDLQLFVSSIFQSSESIIRKFRTPQELDTFRNSNPNVPIQLNDLVILTDEEKGIYQAQVDMPFFKDLRIVANDLSSLEIEDINNVTITNPKLGDTFLYDGINWINYPALYGSTYNRPLRPTSGIMYFDEDLGRPVWWNYKTLEWVDATGVKA